MPTFLGCDDGKYELERLFLGYQRDSVYILNFSPPQCFQTKQEINL